MTLLKEAAAAVEVTDIIPTKLGGLRGRMDVVSLDDCGLFARVRGRPRVVLRRPPGDGHGFRRGFGGAAATSFLLLLSNSLAADTARRPCNGGRG